MNTIKTFGILLLFLIHSFILPAQESEDSQMYWIHEDRTKPAMSIKQESVDKELIAALKQHEITDISWFTLVSEDYRYFYISPIENMAAFDENPFGSLSEKMGQKETAQIFDKYNDCYEAHGDYVIILDKNLSYQPDGINVTPVGKNFRNNTLYYFTPDKAGKAEELARKFKELYAKKDSKLHYRVYRSGFGVMGSYFMVAEAAESPEDYERMIVDNRLLLGQEGVELFRELEETISDIEVMRGYIRPDLSYPIRN
ncbi:MAG: hypothetical protein ACQEWG_16480 [Bacteroidota bacterium]